MDEKYRIKVTPIAYKDIEAALGYIRSALSSPIASEKLYEKIEKKVQSIEQFPFQTLIAGIILLPKKNIVMR